MKKLLHKFMAVMLAGVMALSCATFAAAGSPPAAPYDGVSMTDGVGEVDPADTGDEVSLASGDSTQLTQTKYAGGSAQGISRSEGPLPADPIRLELPTVGARTLDMILDPHGLINRTGMARYGGEDVTFAEDTYLYFLNSITSGDTYNFTDETQALTITNKSNLPVGVDVTLRVDTGIVSGDDFTFDFVDDAASVNSGDANEALMYLALKKGDDTYAVELYDEDIDGVALPPVATASGDLVSALVATTPTGVDNGSADGSYNNVTVQWAKVTSGDAVGEMDYDTKAEVNETLATDNTITMEFEGTVASGDAVLTFDTAIQDYEVEFTPASITNTTNDVNVTARIYEEDGDDETDYVYVYFVVGAGTLAATNEGKSVTITLTPQEDIDEERVPYTGSANFISSLGKQDKAYVEGWDEDGGYIWAFVEDETDANLELWGHEDAKDELEEALDEAGGYPSLSFSIVGAINGNKTGASPWDIINRGSDITLDLIWDVFAVEGEIAEDEGGSGNANAPSGTKATIASITKATGATTSKGKATLALTAGTGAYANYLPTALVAGTTVVTAESGATATSVTVQTKDVRTATTFALRFSDGTNTYDVPITGALW